MPVRSLPASALLLGAWLVATGPSRAADPEPPAELAAVPADAWGFVHVRAADLWKQDLAGEYRMLLQKAGPKALAALDDQFSPAPSTLDRVTAVLLPPAGAGEPALVGIATFTAPFDPARVVASLAPGAVARTAGTKGYFADGDGPAFHFPDTKTLVVTGARDMPRYLAAPAGPPAGFADAVRRAGAKPLFGAVNVKALPVPPAAAEQVPEDFRPLLKADAVTFALDLGAAPAAEARLVFPTPEAAAEGEAAVRKGVELGKAMLPQFRKQAEQALYGKRPADGPRKADDLPEAVMAVMTLGGLAVVDDFLAAPPLTRDGTALTAAVPLPPMLTRSMVANPVLIGMLLPAVQKVRGASARTRAVNNLKQVGLACHNYHDTYLRLPPAYSTDKTTDKPLLGWRVHILPFIEQDDLYRKFRLDEPWDSEHNKKLIPLMPKVYADPRLVPNPADKPGMTYLKVFVAAEGTALSPQKNGKNTSTSLIGITDGTSSTILAGVGGDPVVWTAPEDWAFDPAKPVPDVLGPFAEFLAVFCDGHVQALPAKDKALLKGAITSNGAEVFILP